MVELVEEQSQAHFQSVGGALFILLSFGGWIWWILDRMLRALERTGEERTH